MLISRRKLAERQSKVTRDDLGGCAVQISRKKRNCNPCALGVGRIFMRVECNERGLLKRNAVLEKNPRGPGVAEEAKWIREYELSPYGPPKPASIRRVPEDGVNAVSDEAMRVIASSHYAMRKVLAGGCHSHKAQRLAKHYEDQPQADRPSWRYKEASLNYELECSGRHSKPICA